MKRSASVFLTANPVPKKKKKSIKNLTPGFKRNTNGVPAKLKTTLKYAQTITLNPSAGGCAGFTFRCNSLHDPDLTGTGHQPMGFDQLKVLYDRYTVTGSRIKMTQLPSSVSTTIPGMFGIILNEDTSLGAGKTLQSILEQRNVSKTEVTGTVTSLTHPVSYKCSIAQFFGINGSIVGEGDYSARGTVDPTRLCYFTVFYGQDSSIAGQKDFMIELEYDAVFTEPKELQQS